MSLPFGNCHINMYENHSPPSGFGVTTGGVLAAILDPLYPYQDQRILMGGGPLMRLYIDSGFVFDRAIIFDGGTWNYLVWFAFDGVQPFGSKVFYQITAVQPVPTLAGSAKYWKCFAAYQGTF